MRTHKAILILLFIAIFLPTALAAGIMSDMKYFIFFGVLIFGVPMGHKLYEQYNMKYAWLDNAIITAFIYLGVKDQTINFISYETYRGTSRGFTVGLTHIIILIMLRIIDVRRKELTVIKFPPGSYFYFIFVFISFLSIFYNNIWWTFSFMELARQFQMYLLYWTIFNFLRTYEFFDYFVLVIRAMLSWIVKESVAQRLDWREQCPGPFDHQNSTVMYTNVYGGQMLAYLFNRKDGSIGISLLYVLIVLIIINLTLSRGGLALFGVAIFIVLFFSFKGGFSMRKLYMTLAFFLVLTAGAIKAYAKVKERFENATPKSKYTRMVLAGFAAQMANKELLGVGINTYPIKATLKYPEYTGDSAETASATLSALVESAFLMIAAESGWGGLVAYLSFVFYFIMMALKGFYRYQNHTYQYIFIGALGSFTTTSVQSFLEWVLKQVPNQSQMMFMYAIIAKMNYWAVFEKDKFEAARFNADKYFEENLLKKKMKKKK